MTLRGGLTGSVILGLFVIGFATSLPASGQRERKTPPKEVTLVGRIVDLQNYMTEKFASDDHVQCTQNHLRAGVPAALETEEDGLILLGQGDKSATRSVLPLAFKMAEVTGKLYEKHGIPYLDIATVKPFKDEGGEEEEEEDDAEPSPDE